MGNQANQCPPGLVPFIPPGGLCMCPCCFDWQCPIGFHCIFPNAGPMAMQQGAMAMRPPFFGGGPGMGMGGMGQGGMFNGYNYGICCGPHGAGAQMPGPMMPPPGSGIGLDMINKGPSLQPGMAIQGGINRPGMGPMGPEMMPPNMPPNMMGPNMPPNMVGPNMPPNMPPNMMGPNMPPNMMGPNMPPNMMGPNMPPNMMGPNMPPNMMGPNMPPNMPPNMMGPNMPPNMPPNMMGPNVPPNMMGPNMPPNMMGPNVPPNMPPNIMGPNMPPNMPPNMMGPPNMPPDMMGNPNLPPFPPQGGGPGVFPLGCPGNAAMAAGGCPRCPPGCLPAGAGMGAGQLPPGGPGMGLPPDMLPGGFGGPMGGAGMMGGGMMGPMGGGMMGPMGGGMMGPVSFRMVEEGGLGVSHVPDSENNVSGTFPYGASLGDVVPGGSRPGGGLEIAHGGGGATTGATQGTQQQNGGRAPDSGAAITSGQNPLLPPDKSAAPIVETQQQQAAPESKPMGMEQQPSAMMPPGEMGTGALPPQEPPNSGNPPVQAPPGQPMQGAPMQGPPMQGPPMQVPPTEQAANPPATAAEAQGTSAPIQNPQSAGAPMQPGSPPAQGAPPSQGSMPAQGSAPVMPSQAQGSPPAQGASGGISTRTRQHVHDTYGSASSGWYNYQTSRNTQLHGTNNQDAVLSKVPVCRDGKPVYVSPATVAPVTCSLGREFQCPKSFVCTSFGAASYCCLIDFGICPKSMARPYTPMFSTIPIECNPDVKDECPSNYACINSTTSVKVCCPVTQAPTIELSHGPKSGERKQSKDSLKVETRNKFDSKKLMRDTLIHKPSRSSRKAFNDDH